MIVVSPSLAAWWMADLVLLSGGVLPATAESAPVALVALEHERWWSESFRRRSVARAALFGDDAVIIDNITIATPWAGLRSRPALGAPLELTVSAPTEALLQTWDTGARRSRLSLPLQVSPLGLALDEHGQPRLTAIAGLGLAAETTQSLGSRAVNLRAHTFARTQRIQQPDDEPGDWANELSIRTSFAVLPRHRAGLGLSVWAEHTRRYEPRDDASGRDGADATVTSAGMSLGRALDHDWPSGLHEPRVDRVSAETTRCGTVKGRVWTSGRRGTLSIYVGDELVRQEEVGPKNVVDYEAPWPARTAGRSPILVVSARLGSSEKEATADVLRKRSGAIATVWVDKPRLGEAAEGTLTLLPECLDRHGLVAEITVQQIGHKDRGEPISGPPPESTVQVPATAPTVGGIVHVGVDWSWHGWTAGSNTAMAIYEPACQDRDSDGFTDCAGDCDDHSPRVHPGAEEVWDCVDQDCDGIVDNGTSARPDPLAPVTSPVDGQDLGSYGLERFEHRIDVVGQLGQDDWWIFATGEHDPWTLLIDVEPPVPDHRWEVELVRLTDMAHGEPTDPTTWIALEDRQSVARWNTVEEPGGLYLFDGSDDGNAQAAALARAGLLVLGGPVGWWVARDVKRYTEQVHTYSGGNAGLYAVRVRPIGVPAESCPAVLTITHE